MNYFSNVFCFMDMEELKSVYYGLDILNEPVVLEKEIPVGAVHITSKYGQQYQCSFPDHSEAEKKKEEEEKEAIETGIVEMLKPMGKNKCIIKTKDWWTYEFCYGKSIRQYHMEENTIRGMIIHLGLYESDFDWSNETAKEERLKVSSLYSYHSQSYNMGDKCDLTGNPRKAEVRFMCEEKTEDYLSRIEESETCVYTLTVMTSRICRHPYLKPPVQRKAIPITCNPVLTEEQFHDYMEDIKQQKEAKEKSLSDSKNGQEEDLSSKKYKMNKDLEDSLMSTARDMLSESKGSSFPDAGEDGLVSKELFVEMFGSNEQLWQLYQQGLNFAKKKADKKKKLDELKDKTEMSEEDEEDEKILAEFSEEIDDVKKRFKRTGEKLRSIKKKLTKERVWEKNVEDAVKEAEQEYGMKIDRSLVTGLSKTLNKLVNKLEDTEAEWNSMEKQIEDLTKDQNDVSQNDEITPSQTRVNEAIQQDEDTDKEKKKKEKGVDLSTTETKTSQIKGEGLNKKQLDSMRMKPTKGQMSQSQTSTQNNYDDKIKSPPRTDDSNIDSKSENIDVPSTFPLPKDPNQEDNTKQEVGDETPRDTDVEKDLQELEDKVTASLPDDVKELVEETVRKELENKMMRKGASKLGLDNDHSFIQDKSVHVIQQEDKDGNTNRFIFVLGFKNHDEEETEQERQSTLQENYEYVYKPKRSKEVSGKPATDGLSHQEL